jgi:hypothetical protein
MSRRQKVFPPLCHVMSYGDFPKGRTPASAPIPIFLIATDPNTERSLLSQTALTFTSPNPLPSLHTRTPFVSHLPTGIPFGFGCNRRERGK